MKLRIREVPEEGFFLIEYRIFFIWKYHDVAFDLDAARRVVSDIIKRKNVKPNKPVIEYYDTKNM